MSVLFDVHLFQSLGRDLGLEHLFILLRHSLQRLCRRFVPPGNQTRFPRSPDLRVLHAASIILHVGRVLLQMDWTIRRPWSEHWFTEENFSGWPAEIILFVRNAEGTQGIFWTPPHRVVVESTRGFEERIENETCYYEIPLGGQTFLDDTPEHLKSLMYQWLMAAFQSHIGETIDIAVSELRYETHLGTIQTVGAPDRLLGRVSLNIRNLAPLPPEPNEEAEQRRSRQLRKAFASI